MNLFITLHLLYFFGSRTMGYSACEHHCFTVFKTCALACSWTRFILEQCVRDCERAYTTCFRSECNREPFLNY
nr:unnamed protein product [Fasciola hepatica]